MTRDDIKTVISVYAAWLLSDEPVKRDLAYREIMTAIEAYTAAQCAKIVVPHGRQRGEPATMTPATQPHQEHP